MHLTRARLLRLFVTGLLAALPLALTLTLFWWAIDLLLGLVGPRSTFGSVIMGLGLGLTGSELVGWLMGVALMGLMLVGLGAAVELGLQRGLAAALNSLLGRIPVVRTVHDMAQRLVALLRQREAEGDGGMRSMTPVWCHFGGRHVGTAADGQDAVAANTGSVSVLALLSSPQPVWVNGRRCLAVLVPTAPVPVGGGLMYVPQDWVEPAAIGVEALTSIYVSMGVTSAQHLAKVPVTLPVAPPVPLPVPLPVTLPVPLPVPLPVTLPVPPR